MDSKGFIKDPTIRIVPSPKFEEFLEKLKITKTMPDTLKNYLYNTKNEETNVVETLDTDKKSDNYVTNEDLKTLKTLLSTDILSNQEEVECMKNDEESTESAEQLNDEVKPYSKKHPDDLRCLRICDLEWIMTYLNKINSEDGDCLYLHELLEGSDIVLPENEVIKRNPELEARCIKLRKDQSNRMYRDMTKNVDNVRKKLPEDTIAYQLKAINSHLVAILQFIFSVFAGFMFGFIGIEVMTGSLDFGFRLLLGVMCGLIVALAEIYFLAKKLNEDMAMEDNIQLGGPPVVPNLKLHTD